MAIRTRHITIPHLLTQKTSQLKAVRHWLQLKPHCHPGHDEVIAALVEFVDVELDMRDPRGARRRASERQSDGGRK